jgi:hypothetical protein
MENGTGVFSIGRQQIKFKNGIAVFPFFCTPHCPITDLGAIGHEDICIGPAIVMTFIVYELEVVLMQK